MKEGKQEMRQLVRISGADIAGSKRLFYALKEVRGISYSLSNAICNALHLDKSMLIGEMDDAQLSKVEDALSNPVKYHIPRWLINRRNDPDTGEDKHLVSSDLKLRTEFDIKMMKKIKCYKGVRHSMGQPVRGQKTRSHFRAGRSVGVKKKAGIKKGKV